MKPFDFEKIKVWLIGRGHTRSCPEHGHPLNDIRRSLVKCSFWCATGNHIWRYRCDNAHAKPKPFWYAVDETGKAKRR